ncbi:MAG: DUF167 domain-containing protein [Promethearchaeota archaeon]
MSVIEKKSDNSYILYLNVKPNSNKQEIIKNGDKIIVRLRSKPMQNKANKELLNLLKNKFRISTNQIQIVSGSKSLNKSIKLQFSYDIDKIEVLNKLLS